MLNPYLVFDGNCESAFNFYKEVFGNEFSDINYFSDMPAGPEPLSDEMKKRVMHVALPIKDGSMLFGSDTMENMPKTISGTNVSLSIIAESEAEADKIFNGLAEGGTITMPLEKTFWNAYFGMLTDKFGFHWMVNYDYPKGA